MKLSIPAAVLILSSLLVLSTLLTAQPVTFDPVLDSDGHELKRGIKYYILPSPGTGGGLTPDRRNQTCPLYVTKENSEVDSGVPVTFFPFHPEEDTVRLTSDTNIAFSTATICLDSNVWKLASPDENTGRRYVSTDGFVGGRGPATLSNWFMIERFEEGSYKLAYCPQPEVCDSCNPVCDICRTVCSDLGLFRENGKSFLGFGGSPFPVMFKKA